MLYARDIPHRCDTEVISANALWRQLYRFATTRPSDRQRPRSVDAGQSRHAGDASAGNRYRQRVAAKQWR